MNAKDQAEFVSAEQEVQANYLASLLGFRGFFVDPQIDPRNGKVFQKLMAEALQHYDIKAAAISEAFGVHVSTPGRWAKGQNLPQPAVRGLVAEWLKGQIDRQIQAHSGSFDRVEAAGERARSMLAIAVASR